uniref:Nucleoside-triphosphatase, cancer-related n=1 Tax=Ailuropoda melanoleuca TaxID=9646 RepID=G1L7L4_AILME
MARHVFLTGPPGVGKTTLIQKASEVLKSSGVPVDGFYTEEVRQGGRRIGFDVVTLSGMRGVLSRIGSEPPPGKRECRVGQYVVDLTSFEHLALPVLKDAGSSSGPGQRVCVIDEIGKMELFSQPFIQAVRQTLSAPGTVVLGTIPIPKGKPLALVEEIRRRNDVQLFSVSLKTLDIKYKTCVRRPEGWKEEGMPARKLSQGTTQHTTENPLSYQQPGEAA